jgi:hypothetical protein
MNTIQKRFKSQLRKDYEKIKMHLFCIIQKECRCGEKWIYFLAKLWKLTWVFVICLLNICNKIAFASNIT